MKYVPALTGLLAVWLILTLTDLRCNDETKSHPRTPDYSWDEMRDIFARQQELDDQLKKIQRYHEQQEAILERLRTERLSLQQAATILEAQARDDHPRILEILEDRYPAQSSVERMALLLLEHLENTGSQPERIEHLCCEMTTWSKVDPKLFRRPRQLHPR